MSEMSTTDAVDQQAQGSGPQLWSYRSGSWYAVFGPEVAVLLPAAQKEHVGALWSLVDGGGAFDEVLDALLASGLSRLPGFVLVSTGSGPTRLLLRGSGVSATATATEGEVSLDGATGGTIWSDQTIEGVTALTVHVEDETGGDDFAIPTGLVRVARIDRPAVTAAPAAPAAEPVAQHAAEPAAEPADVAGGAADVPLVAPVAVGAAGIGAAGIGAAAVAADEPAEDDVPAEGSEEPADAEEVPADQQTELIDLPGAQGPADAPDSVDQPPQEDSPLDNDGWTEPTFANDPLTDPLPAQSAPQPPEQPAGGDQTGDQTGDQPDPAPADPAPAGWVTPWDQSPVVPSAVDGDTQPPAPSAGFAPGFPPPSGGSVADPPPPPLPVGSWDQGDAAAVAPPVPSGAGPVAKLLVSDGQTVLVDKVVLVGRAPEARRFTSTEQPVLVTVPSRLHEISSTHVEVRPGTGADQGTAVVTDMGSTNGTVLVQPGIGPEDLKPGIAVPLVPGAIINLGDGITIQVTRP